MYLKECYRAALQPECYPCFDRPMEALYRCGCGRMTFLRLPCAFCGAQNQTPVWRSESRNRWVFLGVLSAIICGGGLLTALVIRLMYGAWPAVLPMLLAGGFEAYTVYRYRCISADDRWFYWKSHSRWQTLLLQKQAPLLEPEALESQIDAWYLDMDRLERMARAGDWETAATGVRQLASVFRNPRLSRLALQILLHLPEDGRAFFDLNEFCANLESSDIGDEELLPLIKLMATATAQGMCLDETNLKRLFPQLLQRYLSRLSSVYRNRNLHELLGEQLFLYCGGTVNRHQGKKQYQIPTQTETRQEFFRRMTTELARTWRTLIEDGRWYAILSSLKPLQDSAALQASEKLERCLMYRSPNLSFDHFDPLAQAERLDDAVSLNLLHPMMRELLSDLVGRWMLDENGAPYHTSHLACLRELSRESWRVKAELDDTADSPQETTPDLPDSSDADGES